MVFMPSGALADLLRRSLLGAEQAAAIVTRPADEVPSPNDYGSRPGQPSWGPYLSVEKARDWDRTLIWPQEPGPQWDERADRRRQAWLDSPFAAGFERLMSRPGTSFHSSV